MPSLWRSANFQKYMASRLLGSFATDIVIVTVGWQIYTLTRDPLDLGLVGLSLGFHRALIFNFRTSISLNRNVVLLCSQSKSEDAA